MDIVTHIITQSGHKLSIDTGSLIINKLESLNHKIKFITDSESDGYKYFLMLNPKTGKYIPYPLDDNNEIIITTAITAYAGKWSALLIACENEMTSNDIDNKQYTYVSDVLSKLIIVKDNFIEDDNATETDIPIYLELIQKFSAIQSSIENINSSVENIYQNVKDIQTDINTTQGNINLAKSDIVEIKNEVSAMESSVREIKEDVLDSESRVGTFVNDANTIKNAVTQIYNNAQITKSDINSMVTNMTTLKNDVSDMKDTVEEIATEVNSKSLTVKINTNGILNFIYE